MAGTEFRYSGATAQGDVFPVNERKKPGAVGGDLLSGGGTYQLSEDVGNVVVLNIWGSWCPPCRVETPQFEQVYQETRDRGVRFVGFDVKDDKNDAQSFIDNNRITYPIVFDPAAKVALQLGNLQVRAGLPQTVLIDKDGKVAAAYLGIVQPSKLKPAIARLINEG